MPNASGWYQFPGPVDADVLQEQFPGLATGATVDQDRVTLEVEHKDYLRLLEAVDALRTDAVAGKVVITDAFGLAVRFAAQWIPPRFQATLSPERALRRFGAIEGTVGAPITSLAWSADGSLLATAHPIDDLAVATVWRVHEEGLERLHEIPAGARWVGGTSVGFAAKSLLTWTNEPGEDGEVGVLRLIHAEGGHVLRTRTFAQPIACAASAPDGFGLVVLIEGQRELTLLDASLEPSRTRTVYADYEALQFGSKGRLLARGPAGIDVLDLNTATDLGRFEGTFTHGVALDDGSVMARSDEGRVLRLVAGEAPAEIEELRDAQALAGAGTLVVGWGDGEIVRYDVAERTVRSRRSVANVPIRSTAFALQADAVAWTDGQRIYLPTTSAAEAAYDGLVAGGARATRRDGDLVTLSDPVDLGVEGQTIDAGSWVAPTFDGSVVVIAESVDGGPPRDRSLTRITFRTPTETIGCTYVFGARTADLTPDAEHLVVELDGTFALHAAVGGEVRGALGSVVDQLAFALVAPVGLRHGRGGLLVDRLTASAGSPVFIGESDVELAALSDDGTLVVSVGARLALWEVGEKAPRWARGDWSADHVAISPDGQHVVLTVGGGVHWFSAADGRHLDSQAGHPQGVRQLTFRADGSLLTLGLEGTIVHWAARGEGRPPGPDAAEVLRSAFQARDEASRAPWSTVPGPAERPVVATLPPLLSALSPPDSAAGTRVTGEFVFYGEAPRDEALMAWSEATERSSTEDFTVDERTVSIELTVRGVATETWCTGVLELARRALRGRIQVLDPREIHHHTFEAGMTEPPAPRYEVVPGARARLSSLRAPHWQVQPQIEERGGWLWWLGPYSPEPGERPRPVAPAQRLRVIDEATGQQIWSQLLTFEGVLSVAPDGRLALLTADDPVEALEEQVGLKLLDPSDNQVVELIAGDRQFARQVQWAPDGAAFGFVSEGEDTRVEVWDRDGPRRFRFSPRAWTFRSSDELVCAGDGELAFIDVETGGVTRTRPWSREDHQLVPIEEGEAKASAPSGFVAIGAEGVAIVDSEGTIQRSLPDLRLDEGVVIEVSETEGTVLVGPRAERVGLSDGLPRSAPGYIEAAAIAGPMLATWHGEELLVRHWSTGEVPFRSRIDVDPRWIGQPSLAWAGESVVLAVDDRVRCVDPDGTRRRSGRVGLVAVAQGPEGQVQTAHRDGRLRRYDVAAGTVADERALLWPIEAFAGHAAATHAVIRTGRVVRHVVLDTGEALDEVPDVPVGARLALSADGSAFAIGTSSEVRIHGVGPEPRAVSVPTRSLVFLPDGQRLVVGGDDDRLHVVRWTTGEIEGVLVGHHGYVEVVDTDGVHMVSAAVDGLVWSLESLALMGFGHIDFVAPSAGS